MQPVTCLCVSVLGGLLLGLSSSATAGSSADAARETEIENLELISKSGDVDIGYVANDTRPGNGKYLCGGMSLSNATLASEAVKHALNLLPSAALARQDLRYLILCGTASASGRSIGGIPVPPLDLLMVAVGDGDKIDHGVLHELYHFIEYRSGSISDSQWNNAFGGYANSYADRLPVSRLGGGDAGFVTSYAQTFAHEDRAELFAYLLLEPERLRAHSDDIVQRKVEFLVEKCRSTLGWAPSW